MKRRNEVCLSERAKTGRVTIEPIGMVETATALPTEVGTMTDPSPNQRVLPNPQDGRVSTGQPSTLPKTGPNRAVDSLICGAVSTLLTTLVLAEAYYVSLDRTDSYPGGFREAIARHLELNEFSCWTYATLAVGLVLTVLALVLSKMSRRRVGRSRRASAGRWLGVINLVAYGAFAAICALQALETYIYVHSP